MSWDARFSRPRLGICAWFGIPGPFEDRLRRIRDAGFEATALWWEDSDPVRKQLREYLPDLVRRSGIYLDHVHAPYRTCNGLWHEDKPRREHEVARHIGWIQDCARHGIPRLVMHCVLGKGPAQRLEHGLESFRRLADASEDAGVTLAVENTRGVGYLESILEAIDSPHLGLCFDTSHDRLYSPEPLRLLERWGHRLAATHISDTDGKRDYHWLPGMGRIDFDEVAARIPAETYQGSYVLETVARNRREDPSAFLSRAYSSLDRLSRAVDRRAACESAP